MFGRGRPGQGCFHDFGSYRTTSTGKVGLTRGNKDEEAVWLEFSQDRERLVRVADAIRQAVLLSADEQDAIEDEEGTVEARRVAC
jgi:5-methylcytosine-specific restriction protein A